ncbi:MAG: hypothetical protein CME19_06715 [Gemmatimonadetes bacterium]|nr:hypothetical protein [Gemmatimonadota bacterium]
MNERQIQPALKLARTTAGLERYVPNEAKPWDDVRAGHLLRRTVFGPTPTEINEAIRSRPEDVVEQLLTDQRLPDPPDTWVNEDPFVRPDRDQRRIQREQLDQTRQWWMTLIANQGLSLTEKMTLFWHDHFATQAVDVKRPQLMFKQNTRFRQSAFGNFKTLVLAMNTDPAMLYYLDGRLNRVGNPNENYARELMELFTMGVGNYTEQDVGEASRALTGWVVDGRRSRLNDSRHDKGQKTILGETGNWNDLSVTRIIFDQPVTARFICRKLYQEFVYHYPDEHIVDQLAQILRENDYELKPVLETLLLSAHFFDDSTIGSKIKSPIDLTAGTARSLGLRVGEGDNLTAEFLVDQAEDLGQKLLDPPNVAGWQGYRSWISTNTLPKRHLHTDKLVDGKSHFVGRNYYTMNPMDHKAYIKTFPNPWDATELVHSMGRCMTSFPVDAEREEMFLTVLLEGAEVYDWNPDATGAKFRMANLLKLILELPEYQLG